MEGASMDNERHVAVIGSDAGGTMTDMFVVDVEGDFIVGKASTTPQDESLGFMESLQDALDLWGMETGEELKNAVAGVSAAVYSGTAMLNTLLTRTGRKVGLLVTRGFEDMLLHERGGGVHAGYGFQEKMHKVAHIHNKPFVPRRLIKGVTERISMFGEQVIPIYEHDVQQAVAELLEEDVEALAVMFLFSYLNPMHEMMAAGIAAEVMKAKGRQIPVCLSSQIVPIAREGPRLNALILQAYGAEPARKHLIRIEERLKESGYRHPLQIMLADGGIGQVSYPALFKACFSGPIGGLLGGKHLSRVMDMPNLVCADMGGTSFDVGLIMGGQPIMMREVELARTVLNIPTLAMDSIGAGTGQYISIDPESKRIDIGPGSAGADPGPVCYGKGNLTPTVMDCLVIMGIINPHYYLGGKMRLDTQLALETIREKCADRVGVEPHKFAEGIYNLINMRMREHISTVLSVRGYSPSDYYLIGYGGAGPMFLSGYTAGLPLKGVFTVPWAAAFSAFGCTSAQYVHRYQKSTLVMLPPGADGNFKAYMGSIINMGWEELEAKAANELLAEGFSREDITFRQIAYVRYSQQLEDVEVFSPVARIQSGDDMDSLVRAFEDEYSRKYAHAAKFPEVGYQIFEIGLLAMVPKTMPRLRTYEMEGIEPPADACKGKRPLYFKGKWRDADIYEMDLLKSGNRVDGLAIIEAPATTMLVPEGMNVEIDQYRRYWLKES